MSPRPQLVDFPNNLIDDERLLSQREREFVATLLRHSNQDSTISAEAKAAMLHVIELAIGETVAQRAYGLLGGSIVRKLFSDCGAASGLTALTVPDIREAGTALHPIPIGPQPPTFEPRVMSMTPPPLQPQHPGFEEPRASISTGPPKQPGPQPPQEEPRARAMTPPLQPQPPTEEPRATVAAITPPPLQPQHPGFEEPRARVAVGPPKSPGPQPPGFEEPRAGVVASVPPPPLQPQHPGFEEPRARVVAHVSPPPFQPEHPGFEEPRAKVVANVSPPPLQPEHPGFEEPQISAQNKGSAVAVMDAPKVPFRAAQCVVLDEFLVPEEVEALTRFALAKETEFKLSEVIAPGQNAGVVDFEHRRSRLLVDIREHEDVIVNRIKSSLPRILDKLNLEPFEISRVEAQMTASGNGDFFHQHTDDGEGNVAARELTFVYFFHREPKPFTGGELRIYDSIWKNGYYQAGEKYQSIQPAQNQIVFFPSCLVHEITPIEIPSQAFADSRFTVNGWFRR